MPSKKKKYNARFPAGRIKKIMRSDEEVGKVAQAVPVIISRTLELFVESLLNKTLRITNARNAKTLSPSHMKQCIMSESRFDFLRELVKNVPDINVAEEQLAMETSLDTIPSSSSSSCNETTATCSSTTNKSIKIQSSSNGNAGNSSSMRNGNKRSISCTTTVPNATTTNCPTAGSFNKQLSLDASLYSNNPSSTTAITISSLAKLPSTTYTPNYYKEIPLDSAGTQQHSTIVPNNYKTDNSSKPDIRPPKLSRNDSAPAVLSSRTALPLYSPNITNTINQTQPVINFDFTKSVLPIKPASTLKSTKHTVPPLTPIITTTLSPGIGNNTAVLSASASSSSSSSSSSMSFPFPPKDLSTIPSFGKMDVCSPLIKIDYSNINFANPVIIKSKLPSTSSSSTEQSPPSSTSPTIPILKIDLSNSFNMTTKVLNFDANTGSNNNIRGGIGLPTTLANNSLEMDEDYDNI